MINLQRLPEAIEVLREGIKIDPENKVIKELIADTEIEIEEDNKISPEHPERKRF